MSLAHPGFGKEGMGTTGVLGADPPAAESQEKSGNEAPRSQRIITVFTEKTILACFYCRCESYLGFSSSEIMIRKSF